MARQVPPPPSSRAAAPNVSPLSIYVSRLAQFLGLWLEQDPLLQSNFVTAAASTAPRRLVASPSSATAAVRWSPSNATSSPSSTRCPCIRSRSPAACLASFGPCWHSSQWGGGPTAAGKATGAEAVFSAAELFPLFRVGCLRGKRAAVASSSGGTEAPHVYCGRVARH